MISSSGTSSKPFSVSMPFRYLIGCPLGSWIMRKAIAPSLEVAGNILTGTRTIKRALVVIVLALLGITAISYAHRTTSDFVQLTLKQGPAAPKRQLSDAEAQAKWNAMWGSASTGLKRE